LKLCEDVIPVANARVTAAIVYKNRIVSYGKNSWKSHPFQKEFGENEHKIYLHAEIAAIINAKKRIPLDQLSKSTLYVARIKRPDTDSKIWIPGLAKPCLGCQKCIDEYQIQEVIYTK